MFFPKTLGYAGMAAALLCATVVAEDRPSFIGEPQCLNPHKHDSGLDKEDACQEAIDTLSRQRDGIAGQKNNCKELSRAGNCIVAICNPTNDQSKLDPKIIASVADGIHAYCRTGPVKNRWTGGSAFTHGLQPGNQEALGATIYLGQYYATPPAQLGACGPPTCQNRRGLEAAVTALESLSPRTPLTGSLLPRAPGDTLDIGQGFQLRVSYIGDWFTAQATLGPMNVLGDILVQNWNRVQPGQGTTVVRAVFDSDPAYYRSLQYQAAGHHFVEDIPQEVRTNARRAFTSLWASNGRPGLFVAVVQRVIPLTDSPLDVTTTYGHLTFTETRIARVDGGVRVGAIKIELGPGGIRGTSFDPIV